MEKYYISWHDYDGNRLDEYQSKEDAEKACTSILARQDADERGTALDSIIKGRKIETKTIQVTSKVKLLA